MGRIGTTLNVLQNTKSVSLTRLYSIQKEVLFGVWRGVSFSMILWGSMTLGNEGVRDLAGVSDPSPPMNAHCTGVVGGKVFLSKGLLSGPLQPFLVKYNEDLWNQSQGTKMDIVDLENGESTHMESSKRIFPLAIERNLERILFVELSDRKNLKNFHLTNQTGQILRTLGLPPGLNLEKIWRQGPKNALFNSQLNQVIIEIDGRIYIYEVNESKWNQLVKLRPGQNLQGFIAEGPTSEMRELYLGKNGESLTVLMQDSSRPKAIEIVLYDLKKLTEKIRKEIEPVGVPVLMDSVHAGFRNASNELMIVDVIEKSEKKVVLNDNISSSTSIFAGSDHTLGVAGMPMGSVDENGKVSPDSKGTIEIYNVQGQLSLRMQIPGYNFLVPSGDGFSFFLQNAEVNKTYLFNLQNNTWLLWPDLMANIPEVYSSMIWKIKDRLFFPMFSARSGSGLVEYLLTKDCLENVMNSSHSYDSLLNLFNHQIMNYMHWVDSENRELRLGALKSGTLPKDQTMRLPLKENALNLIDLILGMGKFSGVYSYRPLSAHSNRPIGLEYLRPLAPVLKQFSEASKEEILDALAVSWTDSSTPIIDPSRLIDKSKIANMFVSILKPLFYEGNFPRTDFIFKQFGDQVIPIILSDGLINNDPSGIFPHGFGIKELPKFKMLPGETKNFKYNWQHNGANLEAEGKISRLSLNHLINLETSPRYSELWKDRFLKGVVVISSNLGGRRETIDLVRQYLKYFRDQDFDFGFMTPVFPDNVQGVLERIKRSYLFPKQEYPITDITAWLKEVIESNQMDYLLKEAHGGGDEAFLVMAKENMMIKGIKRFPDGREERVAIIYPRAADVNSNRAHSKESVGISNIELAQWIQNREKNQGTQLVYMNTSCWSQTKALRELVAVRSRLLVEIPTDAGALTFNSATANHLKVLLTDFRMQRSYAEMEQHLNSLKGSKSESNPYLLPTNSKYKSYIWDRIGTALDYTIHIKEAH